MMSNPKFQIKIRKINDSKSINSESNKNAFFIEGGGTKGVYAIGVLRFLFDYNPYFDLNSVDIIGGTSVGSYLAVAISLGFRKYDILEIINMIDISGLIDSKYMCLLTMTRFLRYGYLYDDTGRETIVRSILNLKLDQIKFDLDLSESDSFTASDITFSHLKKLILTHPKTYKNLLINVVDISRNQQLFMTTLDEQWDNIKLYDALLASSAIPFVFKPTFLYYNENSNKYGYDNIDGCTINNLIDGGVSTNNPLDYFLLNNMRFSGYNLWLLKFTSPLEYVKIDGMYVLLKQLLDFLIRDKNDIKMDLIRDEYQINIINLHSSAGILDLYTKDQVKIIIDEIYSECLHGDLYFGN